MSKKTLSGDIALTKLIHVAMEVKGKNGPVKGIFIPIEQNCLVVGKEKDGKTPIYMPIQLVFHDQRNDNGHDGFISQKGNIKWKEATEEQKKKFNELPILGNFIDWSKGAESNDTGGAVSDKVFTPESDDLPF